MPERTHEAGSYDGTPDLTVDTLLARASPQTLIVFVHGFDGDPTLTWEEFQTLVNGMPEWASCDLYFVGYKSRKQQIGATAEAITGLVETVFPSPPSQAVQSVNPFTGQAYIARHPAGQYRDLVFVGHSQGGVVIRKAIFERARDDAAGPKHPLSEARVRLFAPAIFGMLLSGWLGTVQSIRPVWAIVSVFLGASPSYRQLHRETRLLERLQADTEALAAAQYPNVDAGLQAHILWSRNDHVVEGFSRYFYDPMFEHVDKPSHGDICKPNRGYRRPIEFVQAAI